MKKLNKLTVKEEKKLSEIISTHMKNMVTELNTINAKNTFTGFEDIGKLVLFGAAIALQDGYKVDIKLDIFKDDDDDDDNNEGKELYFDGEPINLN